MADPSVSLQDSMICISCDQPQQYGTPHTSLAEQQPRYGLVLYSRGNYGSAVFDPMDGGATRLELYLCDACAVKKAASIYHVSPGALPRDNLYVRFDAWLAGEQQNQEALTMADPDRLDRARRLVEAKHDAGIHPVHGVVIYYAHRIWRVAGGDFRSPSLIGLAGVRVSEVTWLTPGHRPEPVT